MRLSFRTRKVYFDQIVAGIKTAEVRRASYFWKPRALRARYELVNGESVIGVFVCGKAVHRRRIMRVEVLRNAELALGRPPSEQGRADLGEGAVYKFTLGEVVSVL